MTRVRLASKPAEFTTASACLSVYLCFLGAAVATLAHAPQRATLDNPMLAPSAHSLTVRLVVEANNRALQARNSAGFWGTMPAAPSLLFTSSARASATGSGLNVMALRSPESVR
jgi:hypothetical protein